MEDLDTIYSIKAFDFDFRRIQTLRILHRHVLYTDPQWHFFWEGPYTVFRVSEYKVPEVCDFFNNLKFHDKAIEYKVEGEWIDNVLITKHFQEHFGPIFHEFSELALKIVDDRTEVMDAVLERINHCFLNNLATPERMSNILWESEAIMNVGIRRAFTVGRIIEEKTTQYKNNFKDNGEGKE